MEIFETRMKEWNPDTKSYPCFAIRTDEIQPFLDSSIPPFVNTSCPLLEEEYLDSILRILVHSEKEIPWKDLQKGGKLLEPYVMIDSARWNFLNQGAFGGAWKLSHESARLWRDWASQQPLRYIDRVLMPMMVTSIRKMAPFWGCSPSELIAVANATAGLHSVILSSLSYASECAQGEPFSVFGLDVGYRNVQKLLQEYSSSVPGGSYVEFSIPIPFPSHETRESFAESIVRAVPENTRVAVLDAVTSNTAIEMPLDLIVPLLRKRNILVIIDGAHALGSQKIRVHDLDADFFISNAHKWFGSPPGCAFLWIHPRRASIPLKPNVISHGSLQNNLSRLVWDGYRDYASVLSTAASIFMWEKLGYETMISYCRELLKNACTLLCEAWGTELLIPLSFCGTMGLVRFPDSFVSYIQEALGSKTAQSIQDWLHHVHRIEVPVKLVRGIYCVRISAAVYNSLPQYQELAQTILLALKKP